LRKHADWSRRLPRQIIIPQVMKLATLADVRALMQHLPDGHRQRPTWRYVKTQVADAGSGGDIVGAYISLLLVLMLERVECRLR
jgi:hypothetical protein